MTARSLICVARELSDIHILHPLPLHHQYSIFEYLYLSLKESSIWFYFTYVVRSAFVSNHKAGGLASTPIGNRIGAARTVVEGTIKPLRGVICNPRQEVR